MSSSLDHKCQRCGSQFHGQICPFCTITGLDVNALLASEGLTQPPFGQSGEQPSPESGQVMILDVVTNRVYPFNPPASRYGRDISNDVVLTGDKSLSRFHFQVSILNDEYYCEDAGSRNGTFLNGSPCTAPRKIFNGDIISAGMSRYRFILGSEPSVSADNGEVHTKVEAAHSEPDLMQPPAPPLPSQEQPKPSQAALKEADKSSDQAFKPMSSAEAAAGNDQDRSKQDGAGKDHNRAGDPLKRLYEEGQALLGKNRPVDAEESSVDKLLPGKESELGDTASRFLKLANPLDALFQGNTNEPPNDLQPVMPSTREDYKPKSAQQWPSWCEEFSFPELDKMKGDAQSMAEEIAAKQEELDQLRVKLSAVQGHKNRLLASRDAEMVAECAEVFRQLGWQVEANAGNTTELVLSSDNKPQAVARIVCTEAHPKPNELANLVSSLSTYWSEHGIEPKGILLVAFQLDGPPANRPELTKDYADYAAKNVCLMNSVQLLSIYREIALKEADVESIKSDLLNSSGQLSGFDLVPAAKA